MSSREQEMNQLELSRSLPTPPRFPRVLWRLWSIVWLPIFFLPIMDLFHREPGSAYLFVMLGLVAAFIGFYLFGSWRNGNQLGRSPMLLTDVPVEKWFISAGMITLSCMIALLGRTTSQWLDPFIFTTAYAAGAFRPRQTLPLVSLIILLSLGVGRLMGLDLFDVVQTNTIQIVTWVTTISLVRSFKASRELNLAREEIAQLAVMNERLRIARDLHDLLGHNLSLIALKSELARRLIAVSPERAAVEIGDVESVARTTLQEVREAVGMYRQPMLSSELHSAQEILTAAGIVYHFEGLPGALDGLPPAVEAALGWTVREGVTNVIRHSRARHCTVRVMRDDQTSVLVEILDDGKAVPKEGAGENGGHGLRGLSERVAALGGQCEAGARTSGGFRLAVRVPLTATNEIPGPEANRSAHLLPTHD